jgi:transaldolase
MTIDIPPACASLTNRHLADVAALAAAGVEKLERPVSDRPDPAWSGLRAVGTGLWLDTGDLAAAAEVWTADFTALTTNNSLLNAEVQKGIYDDFIPRVGAAVADLPSDLQVWEVAFALNARHGLRLVRRFGARVSVELHTDLADDVEATVFYGRRYHAIHPERFIVKVPMTPAGLLAARRLADEGIPVNFTLGFSARQNHLAAGFSRPAFVNVFLGRIGAYVTDNALGNAVGIGEKACLASQRTVRESGGRVRQIAASLRDGGQVAALAGVDVFTMPVKVAAAVRREPPAAWTDHRHEDPPVAIAAAVPAARFEVLWRITDADRHLLAELQAVPPATAGDLVARARALGAGDLFPGLTAADQAQIAADGKIPVHSRWAGRIASGELAVDTLLRCAALAAFVQDQAALDARIRRLR